MLQRGASPISSRSRSIDRIINAFPPSGQDQARAMLAQTLRMIVSQQLVRRADGEGRILLIRRKDTGEWGFPAGAVELGESVLDCCKREVREETGLDVMAAVRPDIWIAARLCNQVLASLHQPGP